MEVVISGNSGGVGGNETVHGLAALLTNPTCKKTSPEKVMGTVLEETSMSGIITTASGFNSGAKNGLGVTRSRKAKPKLDSACFLSLKSSNSDRGRWTPGIQTSKVDF
ncbi:Hypothetical predicted protein [Podarcis lilfordi]|uniref:Uncharacterized protein n=1 Tax=Podarcis lilfordi TaxID=74358 RepID=A0AA35PFQ7_9SAUR|nr:Hypothetical predicted protein [Podarcis lilfordi]